MGKQGNGKRFGAYMYCVLAMFGWGTMFVACKLAYAAVSGMTLLFIRYIIAVGILLVIYRNRPRPVLESKDKRNLIFIGIMGYCLSNACQMIATYYIDASLASIINTMTPIAIIIFAILILRERSSIIQFVGIGITIVGAVVIVGGGGGGDRVLLGIIISVIGLLMWGLASVLIRKNCASIDPVWLTIYAMGIAMIFDIPFMGVEIYVSGIDFGAMDFMTILAMIWIGVVPTAVANLMWSRALDSLPAVTCSLFYAFLPLSTSVFGVLLLGERMTINFILGSLIVIGGVIIAILAEKQNTAQLISEETPKEKQQ